MKEKRVLHSAVLTFLTLLVLAFFTAQAAANFPANFEGTWKRDKYDNTLTFTPNTVNASNQDNIWEIQSVSRDSYKIKSANTTRTITVKINKDSLTISGDKGSGENNWNGTWKKQAVTAAVKNFTGNGGKGTSIAILAPKATGLADNQNYLPDLVQGEFVSNFSGFSAMSVLDRVNLDKLFTETLSGYYKDNAPDVIRLGQMTHTNYIMTGTVTKTASGYALQAQIASTADGITRASYSGTCTVAELDNLIGIRRASLELLGKMDVQLTEQAKRELSGSGQENYVNAQTALAQGIAAQRSGNTIETMARFYEAVAYDPSFTEASTRANTMSAGIRTGNLRENIRNDIAWRDEWLKVLDDARKFIFAHPPVVAKVIYDPVLKQGKTDYSNRTVDFDLTIEVQGVPYPPAYIKMVDDLNAGLAATKRNQDWKLEPLSLENIWGWLNKSVNVALISFSAQLVNSDGILISQIRNYLIFRGSGSYTYPCRASFDNNRTRIVNESRLDSRSLPNINITTARFTVKADVITDHMTINFLAWANSSYHSSIVYPVEVITREAIIQAAVNGGLPPMETRVIGIYRRGSKIHNNSMIVEIPSNSIEREFLLSCRPSFPDGNGVYVLKVKEDEYFPEYIDTTHYRFPISVAFWWGEKNGHFVLEEINNNIKPGSKVPVPKGVGGFLIAPANWFSQKRIWQNDYDISFIE
jgi:TolB-like protein